MLTCELVILNTHFAGNRKNRLISRRVGPGFVLAGGYERGAVTAVSGGISRVLQPSRFLPRRVTVSRLEL